MSVLLTVTFSASNTVRGPKPYTIYEIEVRSPTTMPWLLYKRFNDFVVLHENLEKLISSQIELKSVQLPSLPPKQIIRSLAPQVVAKRQRELQTYLTKLLNEPKLLKNNMLLNFLVVPESLRGMLMRHDRSKTKSILHRRGTDSAVGGGNVDDGVAQINELLRELALQKNRVRAISKFEQWYFEANPKMSRELIRRLLIGDDTNHGLVYSCRYFNSKVAWRQSIALLSRLLDIERNEYAIAFREQFLGLDKGVYKEMDLHKIITDATTDDGFRIVKLVYENLPHIDPKLYVPDEQCWQKFLKWEETQRASLQPLTKEPKELEREKAFNWKEHHSYRHIVTQMELQFNTLGEMQPGVSIDIPEGNNSQEWQPLECFYRKEDSNWRIKVSFVLKKSKPSDVFHALVNNKTNFSWFTKERQESACLDKLDENHDIYLSICRTERSPYKTFRFLLLRSFDSDKRKQHHRAMMVSVSNYDGVTNRVDSSETEKKSDLYSTSSSPMSSPVMSPIPASPTQNGLSGNSTTNTFAKIRLGGSTPGGGGVNNSARELNTRVGRTISTGSTRKSQNENYDYFDVMLVSGFEVLPMKDDSTSTRVNLYWQLTGESVLLFSADLLEESKELRQTVTNIIDLVHKK